LVQIGWGTLISLIFHTQQQATLFFFALAMLEVALCPALWCQRTTCPG